MRPMDWALLPFRRYFDFFGRSSRAEYWYFCALTCLIGLVILLGQLTLGESAQVPLMIVNAVFSLITLIPSAAVTVRRLHDINRSGFVALKYLIALVLAWIPIGAFMFFSTVVVGIAVLAATMICLKFLILTITEGDRGPNPYGPNPYGLTYRY